MREIRKLHLVDVNRHIARLGVEREIALVVVRQVQRVGLRDPTDGLVPVADDIVLCREPRLTLNCHEVEERGRVGENRDDLRVDLDRGRVFDDRLVNLGAGVLRGRAPLDDLVDGGVLAALVLLAGEGRRQESVPVAVCFFDGLRVAGELPRGGNVAEESVVGPLLRELPIADESVV